MTIPAGFPYALNQVVEIPLEQIIPNPKQPRRSMRQEPLATLAASIKAKGQLTAAKVRPLTEAERAAHPGAWVMLIGGHRRRQAALLNQFKTLKCTVEDIAPEDTHYRALMDNDHEEMDWWDWDLAIEEEWKTFVGTQEALADRLDRGFTKVKGALKIAKAFNQAARELVDENLQKTLKNEGRSPTSKNKGFLITETTLLVLAELEDPNQVQQALQAVLDDYLNTDQAQNLVKHIQAGHTAEEFGKIPKLEVRSSESVDTSSKLEVRSEKLKATTPTESNPTPSVFWEWVAGVSFIAQIRSKSKKGETLTGGEKALALGWRFLEGVGGLLKHLKLIPEMIKFVWKLLKDANRLIENLFGKTVAKIARIGLMLFLVWAIWFGPANNPLRQCKVLVSKAVSTVWSFLSPSGGLSPRGGSSSSAETVSPPVTSQPAEKVAVKRQPKSPAVKVIEVRSTQPWNTADLDKNYFDQQLAGIPKNSRVTAYRFQPDFAMGSDMASHRLMDLQLKEKYTVLWGTDKETVKSIYSGASNITLTVQSGLAGVFLGGSDKVNVYWEDVKAIYTNAIYSGALLQSNPGPQLEASAQTSDVIKTGSAKSTYEIFMVLGDSKKPLAIQCATNADLEHLVSALEFYIKLSGHNPAPVGSLPYLNQGVLFNNDREVTLLWADSPAGKTALTFGDILWSTEKNMDKQQTKSQLEAALQSMTSGSHNLYTVKPDEWLKAKKASVDSPDAFYPIRKKVVLQIP